MAICLDASNVILKRLETRGMQVDVKMLSGFVEQEKSMVAFYLDKHGEKTTASLSRKAKLLAGEFPGWPMTTRGASLSKAAVERFPGAPELIGDSVKASTISRQATSLDKLLQAVQSGRLFSTYDIKPDVGRVYTKGFNYTGFAKKYRACIIPEQGRHFWKIDAKRVELYILAYYSKCKTLLNDLNSGDYHQTFATKLFGVGLEEVTPEMREESKAISFSIVYGGTKFLISKELGVSEDRAQSYIDSFFNTYPEVLQFMANITERADFSSKTMFGTVRIFKNSTDVEKSMVSHAVQSTAGELIRLLLPVVEQWTQKQEGQLIGIIFDEFLIELPIEATEEKVKELTDILEKSSKDIGLPIYFSRSNLGSSWQ